MACGIRLTEKMPPTAGPAMSGVVIKVDADAGVAVNDGGDEDDDDGERIGETGAKGDGESIIAPRPGRVAPPYPSGSGSEAYRGVMPWVLLVLSIETDEAHAGPAEIAR